MPTKLSDLTSAHLKELSRLIPQKEDLEIQLAALNKKIDDIFGSDTGKEKKNKPKRTAGGRRGPRKGSKPGKMKQAVLAALSSAANGLTLKELAVKLKTKPNNLYSWFYVTGKKVSGIKKTGDKYSYSEK
jgi:hypothetical protein